VAHAASGDAKLARSHGPVKIAGDTAARPGREDFDMRCSTRTRRTAAPALALTLALAACDARPAGPASRLPGDSAALAAAVDAVVESARRQHGIPAASVVLLRGGRTLLARGWGTADIAAATPATAHTVYAAGSISKSFTAAAVLRLAELGDLALDDPLHAYLPAAREHYADVRIVHLLAHTSGIPEFLFLPEFEAMDADTLRTADELHALVLRQPPRFAPGERWSYSNANYSLAAAVLERVTGSPYEDVLDALLFTPLGLTSLHHCTQLPGPGHARGYRAADDGPAPAPSANMNLARGDGGLCAAATDLAGWWRALADGRAIGARAASRMMTRVRLAGGDSADYGFGVSLVPLDGTHRRAAHHGAMPGHSAVVELHPDHDLVIALMTNLGGILLDELADVLARTVLGLPEPPTGPVPPDPAARDACAGTYDTGAFTLELAVREGTLRLDAPPPVPATALRHAGPGVFAGTDEPGIRVLCEPDARRIVLRMAGMHWYAPRVR
jgi:D-alanyl-D-alanine carboxypeptidase